jgi:hypothetical protein
MTIRLHDGKALDWSEFHFFDEFRKVTEGDKRGIALAWAVCADTPRHSIVVAKGEGIYAQALGHPDVRSAKDEAYRQLAARFRPRRFMTRMAAVVNFPLTFDAARTVAQTGADVIFTPFACEGEDISWVEENLLWEWLGKASHPQGQTQRRALILPKYRLIRVKQYQGKDMGKFKVNKQPKTRVTE